MTTSMQARPTTYRGIQMRSRLEADYAAWLDTVGYRWEYEPECFASQDGQWLPDFACSFAKEGELRILTEVKPAGPLRDHLEGTERWIEHVDGFLKRMTIAWASRPDAMLSLIFWDYGETVPYLHVFNVKKGGLWWASHNGHVELLWSGMGQYERLKDASDENLIVACDIDVQGPGIKPDGVCAHLRALGNLPKDG